MDPAPAGTAPLTDLQRPEARAAAPDEVLGADHDPNLLICVAFVDVVGFSAMMHDDEAGTFRRWKDVREEVVIPLLTERRGLLVNTTGDGILAAFRDPIAAVKWSRDLQNRARQRRQGLSLRVTLNYCSVIRDGDDLLGDGVNVAARLQDHAPPGSVVMTDEVRREIEFCKEFELKPIGPLKLRNIRGDLVAHELMTDGRHVRITDTDDALLPSIAVMPFTNLSGDAGDDYFGTGIVEDIVVSLSSFDDVIVISRSSTLAFARQSIDPRAMGEALGVRYLITGTLRRAGERVRVSAELLDTRAGKQLSSLLRDFDLNDIFLVQDEIVETTLTHLLPGMHSEERRRVLRKRPASFSAYDNYLRALDLIGSLQRAPFEDAMRHLELAIEADSSFSSPLAWAARWHSLKVGQGWSDDPRQDITRAAEFAQAAIRIDENNALAQATYGHVRSYLFGDFENAAAFLGRACRIKPNSSTAWLLSSVTLSSLGRNDEAIAAAERSLRLSPFDQWLFIHYIFMGTVQYDAGNYDRALVWLSRGLAENPRYTSGLRTLVVTQVALGNMDEARRVMDQVLAVEPGFNLGAYRNTRRLYSDPEQADLFRSRLKQAGAPD